MNLTIKQSTSSAEILSSPNVVEALYRLTKPDPSTGLPSADAVLQGRIQVPAAYEDAVSFLNTQFSADNSDNGSDFQITVLNNNYYIRFADPEVVRVLTAKGIIQEGEGFTIAQAGEVSIGQATGPGSAIFYQNTVIETFDEFKYFTRWNTRQTDIYGMFQGCTNLISVDLTNVVSLAYCFCNGCTSLTHFHGINSEEGVLELNELITMDNNPHDSFSSCKGLKVVKSLGSLTKMLACLFYGCDNLTTVYQSVLDTFTQCTRINNTYSAFNGCSKLENFVQSDGTITSVLSLPNLTGILGESSFKGCAKITSVESLGSITSIGSSAFENCTNLATVNFPSTITSVGNNAFNNTAWYNNQPNGPVYTANVLYKCKNASGDIVIPNNIVSITEDAFHDCSNLTSVTIGSDVATIGNGAFRGCTALSAIVVDSNNTKYDSRDNCNAIIETATNTLIAGCKNAVIPNTVTKIADRAFFRVHLSSIVIPSSMRTIGDHSFNGSSASTITIDEGVTSIGDYVFVSNDYTSIVFPNSLTNLGRTNFAYCNNLQTIEFGTGITNINDHQFYGGFPASMVSITIKATTPPTIASQTWNSVTCPIYVPAASVNAYKTTGNWTQYASRIQAIPTT